MDRNAVRGGRLKLSELARRRRRELSDAKLDRLVARHATRILAALDRITAPKPNGGIHAV